MSDNMKLWNKVCKTDPKHTKKVKKGANFFITAIDAQYQLQNATEQFGVFGSKWGVRNEKFYRLDVGTEDVLLVYEAELYYPEGSFPIHSSLNIFAETKYGRKLDDEGFKKVATDALTKGLSKLGFNADVFLGRFDDNRYVSEVNEEFREKEKTEYINKQALYKRVKEAQEKELTTYNKARKAMFATAKEKNLEGEAIKPQLMIYFANRWEQASDVTTKELTTEELKLFTRYLKEL